MLGPEGPEERMHNQLHTQTCCTHIVLHPATDPLRLHTQTETGAKVAETSQFKWGFLRPLLLYVIVTVHVTVHSFIACLFRAKETREQSK